MSERLIKTCYEIRTEESGNCAECAETGYIDEDGVSMELDRWDRDEDMTVIGKVVEFLDGHWISEASSSEFHPGVWYTAKGETDYVNGETEDLSYHLYGFTEDEERRIYDEVKHRLAIG